jgi:hypothetical protein
MQGVDRFYRVRFADEKTLREWSMRVMEVAAARADVAIGASRPVVLVPRRLPSGGPVYGHVNAPALGFVEAFASGVELEGDPVPAAELPKDLAVFLGADRDVAVYEQGQPEHEGGTMPPRAEITVDGVRWTASSRPMTQPGLVHLEFESETGERRACDVLGFDPGRWRDVDPATWRTLIRSADAAPSPHDRKD